MRGIVRMNGDGSAKLLADVKGTPNVFLPPEEIVGVRDGDTVTVEVDVGRKGRMRGRVVERGATQDGTVVGVLRRQARLTYLLPDDGSSALVVPADQMGDAKDGDAVEARILREGDVEGASVAAVEEVLGDPLDPRIQVEMAVRATKWPREFSDEVLHEVEKFPDVVPERVLVEGRRDLRGIPHVTIDGADARDFDDAVSARPEGDRYRVWVSIADVSHYVAEGTALDDSARERATSVYFPDRVLPMLPEGLSNELCSLKPNVPRLTMTCEMVIDRDGGKHAIEVYPSLIHSAARLTYEEVQEVLEKNNPEHPQRDLIEKLVIPARWLRQQRVVRGAIDFEIPETRVLLNEEGIASDIVPRQRFEAHRLIEDVMVAANEAVAEYLIERDLPALFRVHDAPDPVKLELLVRWAAKMGIELDAEQARDPKYLQRFLMKVKNHTAIGVIQSLVLRMMQQAKYEPENRGHYGLGSKAYAHFTSPIRRYPDLVVHRALRTFWQGRGKLHGLEALGEHCSQRERKAMEGERGVTNLMACQVASQHVGEVFQATVQGVHMAGAFVRPTTLAVDGLVPMEALGGFYRGFFEFVEDEQLLISRRTKHKIKLGDAITVQLAAVNLKRKQIDFVPAEEGAEAGEPRPFKRSLPPREERGRGGHQRSFERDARRGKGSRWTPGDHPGRAEDRKRGQEARSADRFGRPASTSGRGGKPTRFDEGERHSKPPRGPEAQPPWKRRDSEGSRWSRDEERRTSTEEPQSKPAPKQGGSAPAYKGQPNKPRSWEDMYLAPSEEEVARPSRYEEMRERAPQRGEREERKPGRYGMTEGGRSSEGRSGKPTGNRNARRSAGGTPGSGNKRGGGSGGRSGGGGSSGGGRSGGGGRSRR